MSYLFLPIFFLVMGTLSGCGYRLGYAERSLPGGYTQLAIPVFNNQTSEAGIEVYFTNALIEQFVRSRIAHVIPKDVAQVTVEGTITKVEFESSAPATNKQLLLLPENAVLNRNYRVVVTTEIVLRRISDRRVVWTSTFQNESSYPAPQVAAPIVNSADPLYNHSARYENMSRIAQDMMEEVHDRMTENF